MLCSEFSLRHCHPRRPRQFPEVNLSTFHPSFEHRNEFHDLYLKMNKDDILTFPCHILTFYILLWHMR